MPCWNAKSCVQFWRQTLLSIPSRRVDDLAPRGKRHQEEFRQHHGETNMAGESKVPVRSEPANNLVEWRPFESFRREVDRMFDDFLGGFGRFPSRSLARDELPFISSPPIDVVEKDDAFQITAELPGLDQKDIEVKCTDSTLTIKGEKRQEMEENKKNYFVSERRFGSFQRTFRIPEMVDASKIDASFRNGVLTLMLPKTTDAQKRERKIDVKVS
jgi:HSP20 family protein